MAMEPTKITQTEKELISPFQHQNNHICFKYIIIKSFVDCTYPEG